MLRTETLGHLRIAWLIVLRMWNRNALVDASAMAFSLFLASIPFLALSGAVVAELLASEPRALSLVSSLMDVAPEEVRSLVSRHLERGLDQSTAPVFVLGSLYLGAGAFHETMTVFETAVGAEPRSWFRKRLIAMGCVLAMIACLLSLSLAAMAAVGGPLALGVLVFERAADWFVHSALLALVAAVGLGLNAAFFRIAVRHKTRRPPIVPGAAVAVTIGIASSYAFATYSRTVARYALFYGSLAAVAIFLFWLWLCCVALLAGVELNAHIERERAKKSERSNLESAAGFR